MARLDAIKRAGEKFAQSLTDFDKSSAAADMNTSVLPAATEAAAKDKRAKDTAEANAKASAVKQGGGSVGLNPTHKPDDKSYTTNDVAANDWVDYMVADTTSLDDFKDKLSTWFQEYSPVMRNMKKGGGNYAARAEQHIPSLMLLKQRLDDRLKTETDPAKVRLLQDKRSYYMMEEGWSPFWPGFDNYMSAMNRNVDDSLDYGDVRSIVAGYKASPWNPKSTDSADSISGFEGYANNFGYWASKLADAYRAAEYRSTEDGRNKALTDFNALLDYAYQQLGNSDESHNLLTYMFYDNLSNGGNSVPSSMQAYARQMLAGKSFDMLVGGVKDKYRQTGGV